MKKMTKIAATVAALGMMASSLTGCGGGASGAISVITREDGSGTRGAFTELCGIMEDDTVDDILDDMDFDRNNKVCSHVIELMMPQLNELVKREKIY